MTWVCVDQCVKYEWGGARKCLHFGRVPRARGVLQKKVDKVEFGVGATVFSGEEYHPRRSTTVGRWIPANGPDGVGSALIGLHWIKFCKIATNEANKCERERESQRLRVKIYGDGNSLT